MLHDNLFTPISTSLLAPQIRHLLTLCAYTKYIYLLTYSHERATCSLFGCACRVHCSCLDLVCRVCFLLSRSHSLFIDGFSVATPRERGGDVLMSTHAPWPVRQWTTSRFSGRCSATHEDGCFYGDSSSSGSGCGLAEYPVFLLAVRWLKTGGENEWLVRDAAALRMCSQAEYERYARLLRVCLYEHIQIDFANLFEYSRFANRTALMGSSGEVS